ncbi:FG-GAP repeat domain-containing protein [Steroidobacter sp.]|uniref:FG-GAP repeat domain-containing protein n=1 Tax=Steroidobacter sp. TaxID=1978227 RepID=UPI001A555208|nr:VCBS repeat-containing protein [Steroidobacter sp.]MBL8271886.1 CRTAC1 family protein [Steroidobacter sp.]
MKKIDSALRVASLFACAAMFHGTPARAEATFSAVQPDLFAAPGALASAWADFDRDGDLDLAVAFDSGELRLYRNDRGSFVNIGPQLGLPVSGPGEMRGLAWGDYDGDGDPDLFASRAGRGGGIGKSGATIVSSSLYRNDGATAFTDVAETHGVAGTGPSGRHPTWIDFDNDGDLDLYVTQRYTSNRMYRNDGGRFVDISGVSGLNDPRRSVGSCWFDFDQDGDLDVFVANQQGDKDGFFRNDAGKFTDIARQLGMDQSQRSVDQGGVICALGDYDNDGDFDIFVSTYGANLLYRNEGAGSFREVAASVGISGEKHTVGAEWGDYDNDGLLDLYVTGYEGEGEKTVAKDYLYHNEGGRFVDVLTKDSALHAADHGISWADYDGDGDLDLKLAQTWGKGARNPLFRNELPKQQRHSSLQVQVLDRGKNATRAGSEVRVYAADGKLLGSRLVSPGHAYAAQSVMPTHFGLAGNSTVRVEVTFLTSTGRKTQVINQVTAARYSDKALVVIEGQ